MKKQTVLITGATGTIGEALVDEFSKNGYFVYIHYNSNKVKAEKILHKIKYGQLINFDMRNTNSIKNALEELEIDVLVNNASIIQDSLFFFMKDEQWEDVININLNANFYITKAVSRNMIMQKSGSILNIASVSGICGNIGQSNYSASKGAIIALTKTLSLELGRYNIRVNALAPGIIISDMTKDIPNIKQLQKTIPLQRFGNPDEIAKCAYFMAIEATYVSGEVLNISGGMVR